MLSDISFYIIVSELISIFLVVKLRRSNEHWVLKTIVGLIALVPF